MTAEQFNTSVRNEVHRLMRPHFNAVHWVFEWDRETGFSCDRVNYGPMGISSSSWIVPGTIGEEEPYPEEYPDEEEL